MCENSRNRTLGGVFGRLDVWDLKSNGSGWIPTLLLKIGINTVYVIIIKHGCSRRDICPGVYALFSQSAFGGFILVHNDYFMSLHPHPFLTIINTHYPSGKIIFPYPMLLAMLVRMSVPLPWRDCSGASRKTNTSSTSHLILEPRGPRSKQDYILSSSCSRGFTLSQWQLFLSPAYQGFFCHIYDFMYSHTRVYVYLDTHAYTAYLGTGYSSI